MPAFGLQCTILSLAKHSTEGCDERKALKEGRARRLALEGRAGRQDRLTSEVQPSVVSQPDPGPPLSEARRDRTGRVEPFGAADRKRVHLRDLRSFRVHRRRTPLRLLPATLAAHILTSSDCTALSAPFVTPGASMQHEVILGRPCAGKTVRTAGKNPLLIESGDGLLIEV